MKAKEIRYGMTHYLFGALPARLGDEMTGQSILLLGIAAGSAQLGSSLLAALTFSAAVVGISLLIGNTPLWIALVTALGAGFLMPAISGGWKQHRPKV